MVYFRDALTYSFAPFHDDLFTDLENPDERHLLIVMFREAAKSFICGVAFMVWSAVYKKNNYTVVVSDEERAAKNILANVIYQFQNNELLIGDFGQMYFERKERFKSSKKKTDSHFQTSNGVTFLARGAGQKVRGALGTELDRPDLLVADDLESLRNCFNLDQRNKLQNWFGSEAMAAVNQTTGRILVLANMLHKDSFCVRLRATGIFRVHWKPLEAGGTLAWPDRWAYTKAQAEEYNAVNDRRIWKSSIETAKSKYGLHVFNREFMLNPLEDGQVIIPEEWIKYYTDERDWKDPDLFNLVMAVDPAVKTGEQNDFTAIALMAKEKVTGNMYLIDYINKKLKYSQIKDQIALMYKAYDAPMVLIEDVAAQDWLIQDTRASGIPVKAIGRHIDKRSRVMGVSIHFENGQVFFRGNQTEVVNQITTFTGTDKDVNDDLVDTVTDCVGHFTVRAGVRGFKNRGAF